MQLDQLSRPPQSHPTAWPQWARHVIALGVLTIIIIVVYGPIVLGDASLKTNATWPSGPLFVVDPVAGGNITVPLEWLVRTAWSHFQVPGVDPYQAFGLPLLATQSVPVFPPEVIFHLIFSNNFSLWNVARLIILAFGTYLLATSFGQSMIAGIAVGIGASLVGVAPPNTNLEMLNPLMMLPFVLLSLRYLLDPDRHDRWLPTLGLLTSVVLLGMSGFQEILPLLAVVIAIYFIALIVHFRSFNQVSRIALAIGAGVVGLIIGSIGILPTLQAVQEGMGVNSPTNYLSAVPHYWLATLTIPRIAGDALTTAPTSLGNPEYIFGTPVFALVVLLALFGVIRHRSSLWYIAPSIALVAFGVLAYANVFDVLKIFDFFPFDSIRMFRFLEFAWWLPWCLLLGFVISSVKKFRWYEVLTSLLGASFIDLLLSQHFSLVLTSAKLTSGIAAAHNALLVSLLVMVLFSIGFLLPRHLRGGGIVAALVFVIASVALVPSNFFPPQANFAASHLVGATAPESDILLFDSDGITLPTDVNTAQVFGPVEPSAYRAIIADALPPSLTTNGFNGTWGAAPTMYEANYTEHFIEFLRSLGVNEITSASKVNPTGIASVPDCTGLGANSAPLGLCFSGPGDFVGNHLRTATFIYRLRGIDPLVAPASNSLDVSNNQAGLVRTLNAINQNNDILPGYVFTTGAAGTLARGTMGISRIATTTQVKVHERAKAGGLEILRDTYLPGMTCQVNGKPEHCYPVDGGLWVGAKVPTGKGTVVLNYVSTSVNIEYLAAIIGLVLITATWLGLLVKKIGKVSHLRDKA